MLGWSCDSKERMRRTRSRLGLLDPGPRAGRGGGGAILKLSALVTNIKINRLYYCGEPLQHIFTQHEGGNVFKNILSSHTARTEADPFIGDEQEL